MFYVNKMTLHWQKMVPGENWSYARVVINKQKKKKRINNTFSSYSRTVGLLLTFTINAVIDIQKPLHYVIYSLLLDRASLVLMI